MLLLVFATGFATGCFTVRAGVGPHLTSAGRAGLSASGGVGLGLAVHGHHAIYATPTFGVLTGGGPAHLVGYDSFDYVYAGDDQRPFRLSGRFGVEVGRGDEPDRALLGAAFAYFPWGHHATWANVSGHDTSCEKSCFDLDFLPRFGGIDGLGFELAVDTMPGGATATDRQAIMATMSLVAQGDWVIDL